jgi:hypothetical protein
VLPLFDVVAAALFDNDATDAVAENDVADSEACHSCSDDDDGDVARGLLHDDFLSRKRVAFEANKMT